MVWLSAVLFVFVFLYHTPMVVFVRAAYDEGMGGWVCVGMALQGAALERTVYLSRFPKRAKKADIGFRAVLRVFHGLWQKKGTRMDVKIEIGSGDAAATALLTGGCYALAANYTDRVRFKIVPRFGAQDAHYGVRGMLWAKTGHIALAALAYFREKRRKENGQKAH